MIMSEDRIIEQRYEQDTKGVTIAIWHRFASGRIEVDGDSALAEKDVLHTPLEDFPHQVRISPGWAELSGRPLVRTVRRGIVRRAWPRSTLLPMWDPPSIALAALLTSSGVRADIEHNAYFRGCSVRLKITPDTVPDQ